jgi:hypothetical protein
MRRPPDMEPIDDKHPRGREWHKHSGRTHDIACRVNRSDKWGALSKILTIGATLILCPLAVKFAHWTMSEFIAQRDAIRDVQTTIKIEFSHINETLSEQVQTNRRVWEVIDRMRERRAEGPNTAPYAQ